MQSLLYIKASDGTANASQMTVSTLRNPLATTILVNTVTGVPAGGFFATMGTPHTFTDPVSGETITVISDASAVDFAGHITTGQVIIDAIAPGYTDAGSKVGDIIVIKPSTEWSNNIYNVLAAEHKVDGKHGNVTVDSILMNTTFQDLSNESLFTNAIINGGCLVAQRAAPSISTAYQYGLVDRFAAKATGTAVTAGTINQITSSLLAATKGYDLQIAGLTVTGTGIAFLRYRIEAKDARNFINAVASFGVRVYHNVGSAVNYTVFINKANAADNFSAVTAVANSGAISVPNATATWLKFENINAGSLGDVSNGIEIEIQIACGAVTTKNFDFAEFVFQKGSKAGAFQPRPFFAELVACQRYYETGKAFLVGYVGGGSSLGMGIYYKVTKRVAPTITQANLSVAGAALATPQQSDVNVDYFLDFHNGTGTAGGQFNDSYTADAEL